MRTESKAFLEKYLNNVSPTGFEHSGQSIWLDYIKPYIKDSLVDPYGTAVGIVNPGQPYKVVLEAHADEISWFVNYITPDGLIYLKRNGGVDHQIAPAKRVLIHGKKGIVKAVFGWPAIHTRLGNGEKETQPKVDNLWLDCGARSKKEVEELGIRIGCVVTYEEGFDEFRRKYGLPPRSPKLAKAVQEDVGKLQSYERTRHEDDAYQTPEQKLQNPRLRKLRRYLNQDIHRFTV